jgi:cardiolipin synthase (CMP-forming)
MPGAAGGTRHLSLVEGPAPRSQGRIRWRVLVPPPTAPSWVRPVPNALTFLRLALAFVLPFVPPSLRLPLVAIGAATDFLDGWIARRFDATTELGRVLDGVADKAFALAVVVTLTWDGAMAPWQGFLVLARDLVVVALAAWLATRHTWKDIRRMQVRWAGKLTTLCAFLWFLALLLHAPTAVSTVLFVCAAGASLWAAGDYLAQFVAGLRRS